MRIEVGVLTRIVTVWIAYKTTIIQTMSKLGNDVLWTTIYFILQT